MKTKTTLALAIFFLLLSVNVSAQDFPYLSLGGHTEVVRDVTFSWDGTTITSGSEDNTVQIWEVSTGNKRSTIRNTDRDGGDAENVYDVALSPDGELLAIGGHVEHYDYFYGTYPLNVYNTKTDEILWRAWADTKWTTAVSFSPDGLTIASGGNDHTIDIWEASSGNRLRTLIGHTDAINHVAFSADGQLFASASNDSTVRLWDVSANYRHLRTLTGHTDGVNGVAISPDGQTVATASGDATVRLWEVSTDNLLHTLTGHTGWVGGVAISPDGQTLASGGEDTTVRLWEVSTGRHLHTLIGHEQPVRSVAFSPTEQKLASGHEDGGVLLWELPTTHVRIIPATVVSPAVGRQLTINLDIVGGENVASFEVSLAFDATALRYVSGDNGDYLPAPPDVFYITPVVSEENAMVTLSGTSFIGSSSGDGTLATVTFEVVDTKDSFIDYANVTLKDLEGVSLHALAHSTRIEAFPFGDVNEDSLVNIQDLVLVANSFGQPVPAEGSPADVNGDGAVNVQDLVAVAAAFGGGAAGAPSALLYQASGQLTAADVQHWLMQAQQLNLTDAISQRGISFLEQLLAVLTPKETMLLANYPNPFNPETWIPYQLSDAADVRVTIYAMDGTVVRTLALGHQPIGIYQDKSRAAYWDGRNAVGEPVASGVYFYTLTAGDFSATRKMLIRK